MASGIPVVSTPFGSRGYNFSKEKDLVVVELNQFPCVLNKIVDDYDNFLKIGDTGKKTVIENYDWEIIVKKYYNDLQKSD